jgi:hypothetical protein
LAALVAARKHRAAAGHEHGQCGHHKHRKHLQSRGSCTINLTQWRRVYVLVWGTGVYVTFERIQISRRHHVYDRHLSNIKIHVPRPLIGP